VLSTLYIVITIIPSQRRATLFPYTTLFRSKLVDVQKSITAQREESDQQKEKLEEKENELQASVEEMGLEDGELAALEEDILGERSEEHTSELQSRFDLVCRLLLEKKKKYRT